MPASEETELLGGCSSTAELLGSFGSFFVLLLGAAAPCLETCGTGRPHSARALFLAASCCGFDFFCCLLQGVPVSCLQGQRLHLRSSLGLGAEPLGEQFGRGQGETGLAGGADPGFPLFLSPAVEHRLLEAQVDGGNEAKPRPSAPFLIPNSEGLIPGRALVLGRCQQPPHRGSGGETGVKRGEPSVPGCGGRFPGLSL